MSDYKATVDIDFTIFGKTFKTSMWVNWDTEYGVDSRVIDWFTECYQDARKAFDASIAQVLAERAAKAAEAQERAELARLLAKYGPGGGA